MGAGGLFLQAMPGCSQDVLEALAKRTGSLADLGAHIAGGAGGKEYVLSQFSDFAPQELASSFVAFSCPCTREHFQQYLAGLPQKEKDEILSGPFPLDLECFNCGTTYRFEKSDVETLFGKES